MELNDRLDRKKKKTKADKRSPKGVGENLLLSNFSLCPEMNHLKIIKRGKLLSRKFPFLSLSLRLSRPAPSDQKLHQMMSETGMEDGGKGFLGREMKVRKRDLSFAGALRECENDVTIT